MVLLASVTSLTISEIVDLGPILVALYSIKPSILIEPATTLSPTSFFIGKLSPFKNDSSVWVLPLVIIFYQLMPVTLA